MPYEVHFSEDSVPAILAGTTDDAADLSDPDLVAHCQATRESGVCLTGVPIADVFGAVDRRDFLDSVLGDLGWVLEGEHIVESPFYGILNACRILWLWNGHSPRLAPSKEEAGEWAIDHVPADLARVVAEALAAYRDGTPVSPSNRRTAGREWDHEALRSFRDYMRNRRDSEGRAS